MGWHLQSKCYFMRAIARNAWECGLSDFFGIYKYAC